MVYTYDNAERVRAERERLRPLQRHGKLGTRRITIKDRVVTQLGGRVWETWDQARRAMEEENVNHGSLSAYDGQNNGNLSVYGVKADWVRDTQPDPRSYDPVNPDPKPWRFLTRWAELVDAEPS
jgi:hypothetical protein